MRQGSAPGPVGGRASAALVALLLLASCARMGTPAAPVYPPTFEPPLAPETAGVPSAADEGDAFLPMLGSASPDPILTSPVAGYAAIQERVDFWVGLWTVDQGDTFSRYLERMGRYGDLVDEEIARRGLPASLRYLPIVESGYLPSAVSRVGAVGLWQLMPATARELGLGVSAIVDDRRDPVAATLAALDYLEQLHAQFDSWLLALAAYNGGPGRVGRLLEQHSADSSGPADEGFIRIRDSLPAETRDFIPRFLAAATLAGNASAHGFSPPPVRPWLFDEVVVPDATSLDVVARASGASEQEILELNPHFIRGFTPAGEMRSVRVPFGRSFAFERNYAVIPPERRLSFLEHVVVAGETFGHIAERYGVALSELTAMNGQIDPRRLQIGARLVVPVGGANGAVAAVGPSGVHTVSSGESFWTISRRYGVSTAALVAANGRSPGDMLQIGEELRIP